MSTSVPLAPTPPPTANTSDGVVATVSSGGSTHLCGVIRPKSTSPKNISAKDVKTLVFPQHQHHSSTNTTVTGKGTKEARRKTNIFTVQHCSRANPAPYSRRPTHLTRGFTSPPPVTGTFRPDLSKDVQLQLLQRHREEEKLNSYSSAAAGGTLPLSSAATLQSCGLGADHPDELRKHGQYGGTARDLAWTIKAILVEAGRYQRQLLQRKEEERKRTTSHRRSGKNLLPRGVPARTPREKIPFTPTANFTSAVMGDVDSIFFMSIENEKNRFGMMRAYCHAKNELSQLALWES